MDMMIDMLVNSTPMGAFAAYLIYSNKRLDEKLAEWQQRVIEDMNSLRDQHAAREDQIRERWINVVNKLETERDQCTQTLLVHTQRIEELVKDLKSQRN